MLRTCVYVNLPICLSIYRPVYLAIYLSVYLTIYLSTYNIHLRLFVHVFICLLKFAVHS